MAIAQKNREIKAILFPELHEDESYGIGTQHFNESNVAYEMYREMRRVMDLELRKKNVYTSSETLMVSGEGLPTIKIVEC
jgi:hypothetical protein